MKTRPELTENNRILIIDDNTTIHDDFRKILGGSTEAVAALDDVLADVFGETHRKGVKINFQIDSAYQGQEGLAMVERSLEENYPYAMAFVDMRMPPGWDGVETITRVWAKDPCIQICICTAYSDYSWQEIVTKLGNSDRLVILKKPFDSIEVLQLAHAMTKKWMVTIQAGQKLEDLNRLVQAQTYELKENNEKLTAEMAERELAREALKNSEERLSKAFEACPLPIAILRFHDHACVQINQAFLDATGYDRLEMVGNSLWKAGLGMESRTLLEVMGQLAQGTAVLRQECRIVTKGGEERTALLWMEPFELATGPHLLAIVQDVSEQEVLETRLRHAQKVETVGHLAAGIAHDLNNLLTVILGYSSFQLGKPGLDNVLKDQISEIQSAGQRAAALTRQLLAFSRKQVMQKRAVSLSGVVNNVQAMLRRLVPENITLVFGHPAELPLILADVCNLEQVIVNLVVNARDAMPAGGTLSICTGVAQISAAQATRHMEAREGNFVTLSVTDTGEGMSAETLAQIFEPFFTTKEVGKGTGMGLATVSGIINQHEGWIEVSSTRDKGTTFRVFIPVTERPEELTPKQIPSAPRRGNKETILLVEDDDTVRALARKMLQAAGYRVMEASDGPMAVATWRGFNERVDLLITDMVMPGGLSGSDVAERFHADRPEGKILYSSGYSVDLFGGDHSLLEGVNYLPKPYFAEELIEAVARACSGPSVPASPAESVVSC